MALILLNSFELVNIYSALLNLFSNLHKKNGCLYAFLHISFFTVQKLTSFLIHIKINA